MTKSVPRIYWDACTWIALINKEMPNATNSIQHNRFDLCRETIKRAEVGEIEIVTSAFTLAEVCKRPPDPTSPANNLPSFFNQKYILLVNVDKEVSLKAQSLLLANLAGLKPPDAIHLASALIAEISVFHTFDDRLLTKSDQLSLSDGSTMKIVRPNEELPMPELLKRMQPHE